MSIELHPETRKALEQLHECLAEGRRLSKEVMEAHDRFLTLILRVLNGQGDQRGLDHITRKYVRAMRMLGAHYAEYEKRFVVEKKKTNTNGGAA